MAAAITAGAAVPASAAPHTAWVGTWAASPQQPSAVLSGPTDPSVVGFANQTVREIVHISIGGSAIRLRLSNTFSGRAVTIGDATAAAQGSGAALAGQSARVTFDGRRGVVLPAGGSVLSDLVPLHVSPLENVTVSLFFPTATGPTTDHSLAEQLNYVSTPGDHVSDPTAQPFTQNTFSWYYLSGVDVRPLPDTQRAVVTFGDSITDGFQSTAGTNSRWPDVLARRLIAAHRPTGVLNEGISGNRVLNPSVCFGISALSRLNADVLDQARQADAHTVVLLEGINDLGFPTQPNSGCTAPNTFVTAQQVINGYRQIIAAAHQHDMRIIGATLTPAGGSFYSTPTVESERQTINSWIRNSHAFNGVIDFDKAVRDPANPARLLPADDSGDHLHPNDAGYATMANAINLALLD
ncbi:MAG TPA: SGNH/GDSL hydrolase family protein [Pseudonocardiaceae bacterium]